MGNEADAASAIKEALAVGVGDDIEGDALAGSRSDAGPASHAPGTTETPPPNQGADHNHLSKEAAMRSMRAGGPGATGLGAGAEPLAPVRRARSTVPPVVRQILREVLLLGSMYVVYSIGRIYAARHSVSAYDNAHRLIGWERDFGLPSEAALQHSFLQAPHLVQVANAYYAYVHFPLTALVLVWLSLRRPAAYKWVRSTLMALTGLALVGHTVFPLAPPRMLPNLGWVDTGIRFGQSVYGPNSDSGMANQFAAMPSLHVGWAALVAIAMITVTRSRWRWLWLLHSVTTFAVVVVTANHYWLDGLVALTLLTCCLLLASARRTRSPRPASWAEPTPDHNHFKGVSPCRR
jgi:hypothetical protein